MWGRSQCCLGIFIAWSKSEHLRFKFNYRVKCTELCMTSKQEMEEGGDFHLSCPLHLELNLGMHSILPWWVSFKWIPNRSKTTELSMSQLSELCLTPTRCIRLVCCPSQCDWWRIKARWRHRSQFHPEAFNSLHKIASPWPSLLMDPLCERSWYTYILRFLQIRAQQMVRGELIRDKKLSLWVWVTGAELDLWSLVIGRFLWSIGWKSSHTQLHIMVIFANIGIASCHKICVSN